MVTNTPGSTARKNTSQHVGYLRITVKWNDAPGINLKQWLPAGAIIVGTDVTVVTPFNAGTTNVLSLGYEATTAANIATSAQAIAGTAGLKQNVPPNGLALLPLAADVQVGALYTQTGTAATAGEAVFMVKYIPNNDL